MYFAFYCSGHGFGHATRVSALTTQLLSQGHQVAIVTNAPPQPFSAVLDPSVDIGVEPAPAPASPTAGAVTEDEQQRRYATYRHANVDAGMSQPKAYDIDRRATLARLEKFMKERPATLNQEAAWLARQRVDAVLSDATFLGCAAAKKAKIPAILVTNFTFDSCYSYLSLPPQPQFSSPNEELEPALEESKLEPFVKQCIEDYSAASLLLRLPGAIPIPAFDTDVPLPSTSWTNKERTSFTAQIDDVLSRPVAAIPSAKSGKRVRDVPLIVRPPSSDVYSREFREKLLSSMHVPESSFDSKILLVSFGGQSIPRPPSRPSSPVQTRNGRPNGTSSANGSHSSSSAGPRLLPPGWIAIVCGLAGDANEIRNDLPVNFFASERDVYVPDLTAIADVVLGKLGYGTCSETLSCRTPFVYVPRPLFVEEYGLKRLMLSQGTAVEMTRTDFEAGMWETYVTEAHERGKGAKQAARQAGVRSTGAAQKIVDDIVNFVQSTKSK